MKRLIPLIAVLLTSAPAAGQIVITEIMQNPSAVNDSEGEYFEVYNSSAGAVDMQGWVIRDNDVDTHTIAGSLVVPAGSFAVLCANADDLANGGFSCDYSYGSGWFLANSADEVVVEDDQATEIDRVEYDGGPNWPDPTGAAMVFTGSPGDDNNDFTNWTTATAREASFSGATGDLGSPGSQGSDQNLPVELVAFEAFVSGGDVVLSWQTASETGNSGFAVEELAGDSFAEIGFVSGAGTTTEARAYSFTATRVAAGRHVYRLRQVDLDGTFTYSAQLELSVELAGAFELSSAYPNPFNPTTTFELTVQQTQHVTVDVTDILGRQVARLYQGPVSGGERQTYVFDASDLSTGTYVYRVTGEDFTSARTVVLLK